METKQVHPESSDEPEFCAVGAKSGEEDADNYLMSFSVRRSIKNPTGTRRDSARRDWTSIGLRRARVSFGKAHARTNIGSPGSGLSYTQMDKSRVVGFVAPASKPSLDSNATAARDWRGLLWIALVALAIAAAAAQAIK